MRRVLVTRPEPDASRTAERLVALGFEPVLLPLTKIVPLELEDWPAADGFQAVAITSANAVRHAPPALLAQIAHLPVFAVGERTAEAARRAGLAGARSGPGDAARLVRSIGAAAKPGTRVLVLCGRVRRDTLERGLARARLDPRSVEIYDTVANSLSEHEAVAALGRAPIDAVLLYSALAAEIFAGLARAPSPARLVGQAAYFVISERVANMLPDWARAKVHIAREPTEEAMLSLLSMRN